MKILILAGGKATRLGFSIKEYCQINDRYQWKTFFIICFKNLEKFNFEEG